MRKWLIYGIGTGLGSGYAPVAPGTAGSLLAIILFALIPFNSSGWLGAISFFFFVGVLVSNIIEKEKGNDPGLVVVDEIVGQWIALLFLPVYGWKVLLASFLLFRLFDIWKPFPINRSQNLEGGWGIMIDDVLAGIYANLVLQILFATGMWPWQI